MKQKSRKGQQTGTKRDGFKSAWVSEMVLVFGTHGDSSRFRKALAVCEIGFMVLIDRKYLKSKSSKLFSGIAHQDQNKGIIVIASIVKLSFTGQRVRKSGPISESPSASVSVSCPVLRAMRLHFKDHSRLQRQGAKPHRRVPKRRFSNCTDALAPSMSRSPPKFAHRKHHKHRKPISPFPRCCPVHSSN
jgi:hypothetical protein